jgi:succinyl-CoA synthetase alpha subunit
VAILVDEHTKVLVQGITGREGGYHATRMLEAGTNVVAGVSPKKGGQSVGGVPVFASVKEAVDATGATASVIFVPASPAPAAIVEAAEAGLRLVICITEGIALRDMVEVGARIADLDLTFVGPNCPGITSPGGANIGIMPAPIFTPGPVGIVSRSGTLTYEIVNALTEAGLGQSTCVGIGGDPIHGIGFTECLELFENDADTRGIVVVGEIGGEDEEHAAAYIRENVTKPVVAYLAGFAAPAGKVMGHAGAIITGKSGTAAAKAAAFAAAGVAVARRPSEIPGLMTAAFAGGM